VVQWRRVRGMGSWIVGDPTVGTFPTAEPASDVGACRGAGGGRQEGVGADPQNQGWRGERGYVPQDVLPGSVVGRETAGVSKDSETYDARRGGGQWSDSANGIPCTPNYELIDRRFIISSHLKNNKSAEPNCQRLAGGASGARRTRTRGERGAHTRVNRTGILGGANVLTRVLYSWAAGG